MVEAARSSPRPRREERVDQARGEFAQVRDTMVVEAFGSRMQVELLDRRRWRTRIEPANAIFEYLEIWHNRRRRHSALGWVSPIEFENNSKIVVV